MYKLIFILFIFTISQAQFGASIHVPLSPPPLIPPSGFVILPYDDENMNRSDLVVISPTQIGFWVQVPYNPPGRYILHCRVMRYDRDLGEWYYGPWYENYNMTFDQYRRSSFYNKPFKDYMKERYPKYFYKRIHQQERYKWKENQDQDMRQEKNKNWRVYMFKKFDKETTSTNVHKRKN